MQALRTQQSKQVGEQYKVLKAIIKGKGTVGGAQCSTCVMQQGKIRESGAMTAQGTVLDGHKLALQLSMRKLAATQPGKQDSKAAAKGRGTKLVVRNVAFEATRKDLTALFTPFGQIKSCRLPKKMDGKHRCFACCPLSCRPDRRVCVQTSGSSKDDGIFYCLVA